MFINPRFLKREIWVTYKNLQINRNGEKKTCISVVKVSTFDTFWQSVNKCVVQMRIYEMEKEPMESLHRKHPNIRFKCCCSKTQHFRCRSDKADSPTIRFVFAPTTTISYLLFAQMTVYLQRERVQTSRCLHHTDVHRLICKRCRSANQHIFTRLTENCWFSFYILLHSEMIKHNFWTNLITRDSGVSYSSLIISLHCVGPCKLHA